MLAAFDGFEEEGFGLGGGDAEEGGDGSFEVGGDGSVDRDEGVGAGELEEVAFLRQRRGQRGGGRGHGFSMITAR